MFINLLILTFMWFGLPALGFWIAHCGIHILDSRFRTNRGAHAAKAPPTGGARWRSLVPPVAAAMWRCVVFAKVFANVLAKEFWL